MQRYLKAISCPVIDDCHTFFGVKKMLEIPHLENPSSPFPVPRSSSSIFLFPVFGLADLKLRAPELYDTKGAFSLANPDSDSHNPIFVSPSHLSESEMRFESKESTPNSGFFGFNFNPDSDSPFLYPFHRAHAQCSLGIHHGVQRIELHRYVLRCCLSLFSNEYFRGIEMKLVLIS